jgi:predicted nucleic acid-binding protein
VKAFVDTSAFCAITIPGDRHNDRAKSLYKRLDEHRAIVYTSNYVMDEIYTLLKTRGSHRTAVKFMDQVKDSNIVILWITDEVEQDAQDIFRRFDDKKLSFTDCTSFALINRYGIETVFAFDDHFRYHPYSHPVEFLE